MNNQTIYICKHLFFNFYFLREGSRGISKPFADLLTWTESQRTHRQAPRRVMLQVIRVVPHWCSTMHQPRYFHHGPQRWRCFHLWAHPRWQNMGEKWKNHTLPKTNSNIAPENRWLEDDPFLLGPGIFSGYVSFRFRLPQKPKRLFGTMKTTGSWIDFLLVFYGSKKRGVAM